MQKTFRITINRPYALTNIVVTETAETMAIAMGKAVVNHGCTNADILAAVEMTVERPNPMHQLMLDLIHTAKQGRIHMIKAVRHSTGLGLKEAKDLVELLCNTIKTSTLIPEPVERPKQYVTFATYEEGFYADYRRSTYDEKHYAMQSAEESIRNGAKQVVVAEVVAESKTEVRLVEAA